MIPAMFLGTFWMYVSWAFAVAIFVLFAAWKRNVDLLKNETKKIGDILEDYKKQLFDLSKDNLELQKKLAEMFEKQEAILKTLNNVYESNPQTSEEKDTQSFSQDDLDALAILKHLKNVKERASKKIDKL